MSSLVLHPLGSPLPSSRPSSCSFHQQVLSTLPPAHVPSHPLLCLQSHHPCLSQPPHPPCLHSQGSFFMGALHPAVVFSDGSSACVSLCSCLLMPSHRPDENPVPAGASGALPGVALPLAVVGFCATTHPPASSRCPAPAWTHVPALSSSAPLFTSQLSFCSLSKPFSLSGLTPCHYVV